MNIMLVLAYIFVDLKNVFDTVEHNTRLWKLEHYGIGGFVN